MLVKQGSILELLGISSGVGDRWYGFLGKRGCQNILATRIEDGDLMDPNEIRRHLDLQPDLVVHLAAIVGGIGANRERPAEFFFRI